MGFFSINSRDILHVIYNICKVGRITLELQIKKHIGIYTSNPNYMACFLLNSSFLRTVMDIYNLKIRSEFTLMDSYINLKNIYDNLLNTAYEF